MNERRSLGLCFTVSGLRSTAQLPRVTDPEAAGNISITWRMWG